MRCVLWFCLQSSDDNVLNLLVRDLAWSARSWFIYQAPRRLSIKRRRHFPTVEELVVCSFFATVVFVMPSVHENTIRHRNARACKDFLLCVHRVRVCSSSTVSISFACLRTI